MTRMKWLTWGSGIAIGAVAGYLYWYYIGCASGSCAITSSPVNSTIYGALMGGLLTSPSKSPTKSPEATNRD